MNTTPTRPVLRSSARRRAGGSIVINTAIALGLIVITLVGAELGYLFYVKRELQKTVDLAALAGAQRLTPSAPSNGCDLALVAASANATQNLSGIAINPPECGSWKPDGPTGGNAGCFKDSTDHFMPNATPSNAVRVRIEKAPLALLPFFSADRTICVQAVATLDEPVAAFTVGSRLLRLEDNTLLPNLLKAVGVDLSSTDILSYKGLANTSITPAGLLAALGIPISGDLDVGTLNQLASIQNLTLGSLLDATVIALQNQGGAVGASISLLQRLRADLSVEALAAKVKLFGNDASPGILVGLDTTGNAALNAKVDLLSLVTAGVSVANGKNLVSVPNLGVGILGVAAKASVIEPPSIGIGGIGAIARTAQIRVYLRVNSSDSILGPILEILGTGLDVPLILELAQSTGRLSGIACTAPRSTATIAVTTSQVNLCLGRFHDMTKEPKDDEPDHFFSENNRCAPNSSNIFPNSADGVRRHPILRVLGAPVNVRVGLPLLTTQAPIETAPPLKEPSNPSDGASQTTISATSFNLSQTVSNIVSAIFDGILGDLLGQSAGVLTTLINAVVDLLNPLLGLLGQVITKLLSVLGLSIGQTDVSLLSVDCGVSKLVH